MRTIDKGKGAWRKGIAAVAAIPMVFTLMTAGNGWGCRSGLQHSAGHK